MDFKLKYNRYSSNGFFHSCIDLVIESDNTIIKTDIVRNSDKKIDGSLIVQLQDIVDEMKEHNENVDNYNELKKQSK